MRTAVSWLCGVGGLAALTFVALYARVGWWRIPTGRHLMAQSAVLAAIFTMVLMGRWVGGLPALAWVIALAVLDAVLWGQVALLLWVWRRR